MAWSMPTRRSNGRWRLKNKVSLIYTLDSVLELEV
jgi:hypothetical protein